MDKSRWTWPADRIGVTRAPAYSSAALGRLPAVKVARRLMFSPAAVGAIQRRSSGRLDVITDASLRKLLQDLRALNLARESETVRGLLHETSEAILEILAGPGARIAVLVELPDPCGRRRACAYAQGPSRCDSLDRRDGARARHLVCAHSATTAASSSVYNAREGGRDR